MLSYSIVQTGAARPSKRAAFLHGLLGRGSNWQTFAKRLIAARPEYDALLVDLRLHGASQQIAPPHTLEAAASDVRALFASLSGPPTVSACIGHSFGGKLAVRLLERPPQSAPQQVWILDASPSERLARSEDDLIGRVLSALGGLPALHGTRSEFTAALEQRGIEASIAQWLTKNLVREGAGYRFGMDLGAIAELLADHDRTDVWRWVEQPPSSVRLCFVLGGRSRSLARDDRERLRALAARGTIELFEMPEAGHWLHTDDPDGLLQILRENLV